MNFSDVEVATLLAALRYWQRNAFDDPDVPEWEIAKDAGPHLDREQIDDLCHALNFGYRE